MQKILLFILSLLVIPYSIHAQPINLYPIRTVDVSNVLFTEGFWKFRYEVNRDITVPHIFNQLKVSRRIDNLLFAAGIKTGEYCTRYQFDDSDIYKSIEAASYVLMQNDIPELEDAIDSLVVIIGKAQHEDGYLYPPRDVPSESIKKSIGPERWSRLQWSHELYNMGHLYEAAAAYYNATGKNELLDIALKNAELIISVFNPHGLQIPPGHQEIELGLVRLYEVTGAGKYLQQAKYFLDIRGRGKELTGRETWGEYSQDHIPPVKQTEAVGHAVRAAYMYTAMTDIAALFHDDAYKNAVNRLWENVTGKKIYITGGIGSTGSGEAFGSNYDLPNASAYNESCSSIANMLWNYRMFQLYGDGKYLDVFERTLYNAFLSGIGMEGNLFFYPNPLVSYGSHFRTAWFTCACCPPNIARFIASLSSRMYALKDDELFVTLYASSTADLTVNGNKVKMIQGTEYPWDGKIKITVLPENESADFKISLRVPGWSLGRPIAGDLYSFLEEGDKPALLVNGEKQYFDIVNGFISIRREWFKNDIIELQLPMKIHRIVTSEKVKSDIGKVALQLGPVVYCVEWVDNSGKVVDNLLLDDNTVLYYTFNKDLLNGVNTIHGMVKSYKYVSQNTVQSHLQEITAIPYYSWAHRGSGEMSVWLARDENFIKPRNGPTLASLSTISVSSGKNPQAVNDQFEPDSSGDESVQFFHWWPNKGTDEWVLLDLPEISEISKAEVYWFDDTGRGECRIPESWRIMYKDGNEWREVYTTKQYSVEKDKYCDVLFETVRTKELKIIIRSQKDFAGGIHEIKIK